MIIEMILEIDPGVQPDAERVAAYVVDLYNLANQPTRDSPHPGTSSATLIASRELTGPQYGPRTL